MSLKDLSPIKGKFFAQHGNSGVFSANVFNDQVESIGDIKQLNLKQLAHNNNVGIGLLPTIDTSRQRKIVQLQNIPSSILEELYQKRQHVNPNKQLVERRRNSIEKGNANTHYYSTKSFANQTAAQKNNSLSTVNQSPIGNPSSKNNPPNIFQNQNGSTNNNLYSTFNNGVNNTSINNNNPILNSSLIESSRRNHSLRFLNPSQNSQNFEGDGKINNGMSNSFVNNSIINHQSSIINQKSIEDVQILRKLDSKDNFYAKMYHSDKKMTIETDIQKIRNNIILNNDSIKQIYSQRGSGSISMNNTPIHSSLGPTQPPSSIQSSTNKLMQQLPFSQQNLGQNKLSSISQTQRDFKKHLTSDMIDTSDQMFSSLQKKVQQDFRSTNISPLNISKNDVQEQLQKRNSYINQCIKDDMKKEVLSKTEMKEILNAVQKNFGYMKVSQNNMKKGGERKDVIELSQWFDQMTLQLLGKENFTLDSFLEEYEIIYNGCLSEISRQVSNDCFERGQLLEKLWKIILFISKEFIKKAQQKYKATELQNLQEQGKVHHSYLDQIAAFQKTHQQQSQIIEQKDVLIRKLYQQKEATKKKYKKYELMYTVLYEDFEFLERYIERVNFQTLNQKQRIAAYEAQERLYIKDSDPKLKIKDEINKITQTLSDQFILQLEDQKTSLQELYEIKKDARYKLQVIEKNLDYEFKNGKLEKKGGMEIIAADADDIQLDDDYGQIQMNDQETSTEDLISFAETAVDTSDLCKKETKSTNTWIVTHEIEIQATSSTQEVATQADIKKIMGNDETGKQKKIKESLAEIMSEYEDMKLPVDSLKNKNYNIYEDLEFEYNKWSTKNKEIVTAFQQKDEYTAHDYKYLTNYLEQHASKTKEFMMECLFALLREQQTSIQYKIETFETHLDNQIINDRVAFQTSTLKKIIPKYNELKKENNLLSQTQAQSQFQANQQQSNKNINGRRVSNMPYQQFNKQSSLTYLEPYSDSPDRKASRRQIEQASSLSMLAQKSPMKRQSTFKLNESLSPTRTSGSFLQKQKSQQNFPSGSNLSPQAKKKSDNGSSNQIAAISKMKNAIDKINTDYKNIQSHAQSTSIIQNDSIASIPSLPDVSKQLRSITHQVIKESDQLESQDNSQNEDLNTSINRDGFYQNGKYTQSNNQEQKDSRHTSLHQSAQSLVEEKQQNEKVADTSIDQNLSGSKNPTQNEIQLDQPVLQAINQNDNANKNNLLKLNLHPANQLNINLPNIQEQPEADENNTTPVKANSRFSSPRKNNFDEEKIKQMQSQIDNKQEAKLKNSNENKIENEQIKQNDEQKAEINENIKPRSPKKKLTIQECQTGEANLQSDLSSDSEAEGKEKPYVTNREQIQDQVYDKKYLDESAADEALREQAENDEFELALRNLDSNVNNVQPNPNIYSRMRIHASTSKFTDLATEYLIKSFKEMKKKKNSNFFFKLTQILKIVFTILQDINKVSQFAPHSPTNKFSNPNPTKYHIINHFHIHLFENLMTSYGTGQMMFKKFFRILNGIFKYKKHPRINILSKFLTGEYDLNDFQLFVKLCIFLYPELQSNEERILINQTKCNDALNHFLYTNLNQKQVESIEKTVNKIKIKGVQKNQYVYDFDQILELIMETFVRDVKIIKTEDYRDLYYSQDTEKRDHFNYESFKIVLQSVQGQNSITISNLFYKESDKILNGENLLSLQRFSLICRQNKILSQTKQTQYLAQPSQEFIEDLSKIWSEEQYNIKLRLIKVKKYDMKRRKMLNEIDIYLNDTSRSRHSIKTIHFIYNLLQQESKELLVEEHIQQLMPQQFQLISQKYHHILKTRFNHLIVE